MEMKKRALPHGGEQISILGLGMGSIHESSEEEIEEIVRLAIEHGINIFDLAASSIKPYQSYGKAIEKHREQVYLQMHFGAIYENGKYGWTRDLNKIKKNFEDQLALLRTDYTDMGFLHCIDEESDVQAVFNNGLWEMMLQLKEAGTIRHLGLSTHNPDIARHFIATGLIDMIMFSINPAYDYSTGDYGIGSMSERQQFYTECEKAGVGISVMKPFGGGQLLNEKTSPFKRKLTKNQCIQYALDRPAVLTVLPGVRNRNDLLAILDFLHANQEELDYSVIGEFTPTHAEGICVYCNHCQPCPQQINVGLINKYYDLALAGDVMAKGHYDQLSMKADACVACGHCEFRCPFSVKQEARMRQIAAYFKNSES